MILSLKMDVNSTQTHLNKSLNKPGLSNKDNNNNTVTKNTVTPQASPAIENKETTVTLSPEALSRHTIDKNQNAKAYEANNVDYKSAKDDYQKKTNDLPVDYRKIKVLKDRLNEEIKALETEISRIKSSMALNKAEMEQKISSLEQQITAKSLAVIEAGKEFNQKLKEEERSQLISPESAAEMMNFFNSSPPQDVP